MIHDTTRDDFDSLTNTHRVIPVVRTLFADGETPVALYRKVAQARAGSFLLESAEQGGIWSRFSFIGVRSFGALTQTADASTWLDYGMSGQRAFGGDMPEQPLAALERLYETWHTEPVPGLPPLTGGMVGFVGWEAVRELEDLPRRPDADVDVPGMALCFVADLIVVDHQNGTVLLLANALNDGTDGADQLWSDAQRRLDELTDLMAAPAQTPLARIDLDAPTTATSRTKRDDYLASVEAAREHIRAGDIFQVVISQRFEQACSASPLDVYRVLRTLNPSPYMYLVQLERPDAMPYAIVGSSPEALVKVSSSRAYMHPIAGSKPRGTTPDEDARLEHELAHDDKERSEHLMLVDLARNDLARVCRPGSVNVTEFMRVERFSHIMHLVSSVVGDLREGVTAVDALRATFPAGTLSGAPKPKALDIIDELEPVQRGAYGGVVGYVGFGGDADLAIAIRTTTLLDGVGYVQAGAGLVADSHAPTEFHESENKAAAPLRAIAIANALAEMPS